MQREPAAGARALSSLAIIEYVYDWHGAGYGLIWALAAGDGRLVTALVLAFATLFTLVGGATAIAAHLLDPRVEVVGRFHEAGASESVPSPVLSWKASLSQ